MLLIMCLINQLKLCVQSLNEICFMQWHLCASSHSDADTGAEEQMPA